MAILDDVASALQVLQGASANSKLDTSNPFGFITNQNVIQNALNEATNAAYDLKTKEARQALSQAENTSYSNTQNAINDVRKSMIGSASSGGNVGAAGATALQALLGLGQQNNALVTEGLQGLYNVADERASALKQNAADAITQSNSARQMQANSADTRYTADQTRSAEALAALSALAGTEHTNYYNDKMNTATNASNERIADKTQKQTITYAGGYKVS